MKGVCLYALGGGLGHATRALAVGRALHKLQPDVPVDFILPDRVQQFDLFAGARVHSPPPECREDSLQLARWLDALWAELKPGILAVDVFPRGILAEFLECRRFPPSAVLLTRICRRGYYEHQQMKTALKRYEEIYWVESCPVPAVLKGAREVGPVTLFRRDLLRSAEEAREGLGFTTRKGEIGVLVVRAGQAEDQRQLLAAVRQLPTDDLRVTLADHNQPALIPLFPYYPGADLIVSAGGYHSVYELLQLNIPTIFWPQRRLYDDQAQRLRLLEVGRQPKRWIVQTAQEFDKAFEEYQHLRTQMEFRGRFRRSEYSGAQRLAASLLRRLNRR